MSYRTCIEGVQIFGNNDYYPEWIDFIKSQGISVSEDNCYEGYITDFMGALTTVEKIVMSLHKKRQELRATYGDKMGRIPLRSLFDFSYIVERIGQNEDESSLTDELLDLVDQAYAFIPYALLNACEEKLERLDSYSTPGHFNCYRVKEGMSLHVRAR